MVNKLSIKRLAVVRLASKNDDILSYNDLDDKPKFGIKDLDELKTTSLSTQNRISSINATEAAKSATFGTYTVEDLKKRMIKLENSDGKPLPQKIENLNGINPLTPLVFSSIPFAMAYLGYLLSSYLSANFAVSLLASDVYTFQRVAIVSRNIIVGLTTLAKTFSFVIGIGLLLLGITVAIGGARP
jgi:hypothetical protein